MSNRLNPVSSGKSLAKYGLIRNWPKWLVYLRGLWWLRSGFCPCCYSSPPRCDCPVCYGDRKYGPYRLSVEASAIWRNTWRARYAIWRNR